MLQAILPLVVLGQTTDASGQLIREGLQEMQQGMTGYAVGWGTLMLINAGLAQGKNRSGLAWFFASLFLGPIATFLVVVLDKRPPKVSGK